VSLKETLIVTAMAIILAISLIGMYSTWQDCKAKQGMIVRGLFGMECLAGGLRR
jgi:hypothetical protein